MARYRTTRGFSLVEIMIVVLIIGILLAIAVPNFIHARTTSRLQAAIANLSQIDAAKQQFAIDQQLIDGNAVNDATDLVPKYLPAWPTGPIATAVYTANAVGSPPMMSNYTAADLENICNPTNTSTTTTCPF